MKNPSEIKIDGATYVLKEDVLRPKVDFYRKGTVDQLALNYHQGKFLSHSNTINDYMVTPLCNIDRSVNTKLVKIPDFVSYSYFEEGVFYLFKEQGVEVEDILHYVHRYNVYLGNFKFAHGSFEGNVVVRHKLISNWLRGDEEAYKVEVDE